RSKRDWSSDVCSSDLTHIRHGRKPTKEALDDLRARYRAIGGISPFAKITEEQVYSLQDHLNTIQDEIEFKAYIGLKHIEPFIERSEERRVGKECKLRY